LALEWFICAVFIVVATPMFGHLETVRPVWVRIARWLVYLAVTGLLGRPGHSTPSRKAGRGDRRLDRRKWLACVGGHADIQGMAGQADRQSSG
jgi:hypothetical protein